MSATMLPGLAEPGHEHLHDAEGSDTEGARATTLRVLFPDRAQAEAAVAALYEHEPVAADSISIAPAPHVTARLVDRTLPKDLSAMGRHAGLGALLGAPVGILLGVALPLGFARALAVPLMMFAFAGFGALVGALIGLARADPLDDDPVVTVVAGGDAVVVTVRHLAAPRYTALLTAFGGLPIEPEDVAVPSG
jgi:hypothetical protein